MRIARFSIRQRVLGACLLISLAAVAGTAVGAAGFLRVLRARAREGCTRMAAMFTGYAHDRLVSLVAEATALADALGRAGEPAPGRTASWFPAPGARTAVCSWALYEADGLRVAVQRAESAGPALDRLGIGAALVAPRERARVAEALGGRPAMVLVPDGERIYAVSYQPVLRPGQERAALQVATELAQSLFPAPADAYGARAFLRPFDAGAGEPRRVTLDGRPFLIVYQPLVCGARRLGTVVAALPYDTEARYEQAALFTILVVVLVALLVLALVSHVLTDVVVVPIERLRDYILNYQSGAEVERLRDIPDDEAGTILQAYQEMLDQSQDWADRLMESNRALRDLLTGSVEALVTTIEAKDRYTAGHSQRVADAACAVARQLAWEETAIEELRLGALFHDIGKVGIAQSILNKTGGLTKEELEVIRQHPVVGARILSSLPGCANIVRAILHHHERFNGGGYPAGLAGDAIPLPARLIAIADVYDALTSERSYRAAYSHEQATAILVESKGSMHDPELLGVFLQVIHRGPRPGQAEAGESQRAGELHAGSAQEALSAVAEERS